MKAMLMTNAGGPGVTAADALEANGMVLAEFSAETQAGLEKLLPPAASLHNPVDMLASASPEQYAACLQILLQDPGVHSVMVILPPPPMYTAGAVAKSLIPVIHSASFATANFTIEKPVVIALMGERLIQEAVEHFRAAHVPEYRFPERAASALAVLAQRAETLGRAESPLVRCCEVERASLEALLQPIPAGTILSQEVLQQFLEAYGIPIPPAGLATSPEEAAQLARQMGLPVALKVISPELIHKTDANGVILNLHDEAEVMEGFAQVLANVRALLPQANILGVQVQRMISGGQDVIIGAVQDRQFGPLVMFGSGGIEVEGLQDVAFSLAPITEEEAENLLHTTWAGRKLEGFRSLQPGDRAAVLAAIQRLAQLAADWPQIAEIEINPLRVLPGGSGAAPGQGAFPLDVRARLAG